MVGRWIKADESRWIKADLYSSEPIENNLFGGPYNSRGRPFAVCRPPPPYLYSGPYSSYNGVGG